MPTLSATRILQETLEAFRTRVPMLGAMSTNFDDRPIRLGETVKAHITTLPTASTWDANTGYANGANEARSLMEDVDVVVDQHRFVTIKWGHINNITDQKDSITHMASNAAYVLGKAMVDSILAKVTAANISYNVGVLDAEADRETLRDARKLMNENGAAPLGRVIIGNSDFTGAFGDDPRIASRDYSGQQTEADAFAHWRNIEGFGDIWEYPDFPANAHDLIGVAFESRAICLRAGLPDHTFNLAQQLGIPAIANTEVVTDPDTGFSLLGITWQQPGTFELATTLAAVWGSAVGKQGGDAGTITDKAALRFVETTAGD